MRLIFMGSPKFSVPGLERLVSSQYQVVAVYTQPDRVAGRGRPLVFSPVKMAATAHGLPVIQPTSFKQPDEIECLASLRPDLIVVAAYAQILPQRVLDIPRFGCINIHPSLLPRHRGPSPVASAILAGDEVTGVTIMLMDSGLDTGPVLDQVQVAISPQDTTGSLAAKLAHLGAQLLEETMPSWFEGRIKPRPQDEASATYSKLIAKEDGRISWHLSATEIWRRVRAFQPWPGCYTSWRGKLLKVIEAVPLPGGSALEPGRVVAPAIGGQQSEVVGVQTGEGVLGLRRVQLEGRRAMSAAEFLRGQKGLVGELLL